MDIILIKKQTNSLLFLVASFITSFDMLFAAANPLQPDGGCDLVVEDLENPYNLDPSRLSISPSPLRSNLRRVYVPYARRVTFNLPNLDRPELPNGSGLHDWVVKRPVDLPAEGSEDSISSYIEELRKRYQLSQKEEQLSAWQRFAAALKQCCCCCPDVSD